MIASSRARRATLRARTRDVRAAARVRREMAQDCPLHTTRSWLVSAGLNDALAHRFAPAFSRSVSADATRTVAIKLAGRRTKRVAVKLYGRATFTARLAAYRPREAAAARRFAELMAA